MGERKTRCKKITAPYPFFFNALYEIWQMEMCCQMIQYLSYCIGNEKYAFHDANPNFYPFTNWSWEVHFKCKASDGCCYVRHNVYIHTLYIYIYISFRSVFYCVLYISISYTWKIKSKYLQCLRCLVNYKQCMLDK